MLKFTQLLCAAALALGSTAAMAQTVSETPVASPADLTDGYYVIKGIKNDNSGTTGYIYYYTEGNDRRYLVDESRTDYTSGETPESNYIWELRWEENDGIRTFTLQNVESSTYFIADPSAPGHMKGSETANLQVETDADGNWFLTMTNYQHSGSKTYITMNTYSPGPSLGWWQDIDNGADVLFTFYPVEMPDEVAYDADYAATVEANLGKTGVGYPVAGVSTRQL